MIKVQFETVSESHVLVPKNTLEELIRLAERIDEIEIDEIRRSEKESGRGSLRGIWRGSQISEETFLDARRSLFGYEES